MPCIAIIQARMGSSRLPGKTLEDIGGCPAVAWTVRAAMAVPGVEKVVVATTVNPEDDALAAYCAEKGWDCVRGHADDVLLRFITVLDKNPAFDVVMRLTADCPFLDPHVCGEVLALFHLQNCDYATNAQPCTWPDGLDCEVISAKALRAAHAEATRPSEREHVTSFVSADAVRFKPSSLICPVPGLGGHRWTLDNADDLTFIRAVAAHLPTPGGPPAFMDILAILKEHPQFAAINSHAKRNESYFADVAAETLPEHKGYARSQALLKTAKERIPLGSQTFSKSYIQYPANGAPLFASHGSGGRIWDVDGNEYVDLVCGLLCINLGYNDPDVDQAIRSQLVKGISFSLNTDLESRLAGLIAEMVPSAEMVRFAKNGTDVTSAAVRLARGITGRDHVVFCGYHGWQDWYVGATSMHKGVPQAVRALTHHVPYNDFDRLQDSFAKHPDAYACLILEPLSGDGPKDDFLDKACDLARSHGALVIFDEVITGFRLAPGGAQEHFGVTPDLTALGKGLANGMPLSALAGSAKYMSKLPEIFFSGTFGGETLSLAAAIAVLEKIKRESVIKHMWQVGEKMAAAASQRLQQAGLADLISLSGLAPWKTLHIKPQAGVDADMVYSFLVRDMARNGVLMQGTHNICYAHSAEDVAWVDAAYAATLGALAKHLNAGTLAREIDGQIVRPLFKIRP